MQIAKTETLPIDVNIFVGRSLGYRKRVCFTINKRISTSVSRLHLFPIVGLSVLRGRGASEIKTAITFIALICLSSERACPICSMCCRVNGSAHTLNACHVYLTVHRVNGPFE